MNTNGFGRITTLASGLNTGGNGGNRLRDQYALNFWSRIRANTKSLRHHRFLFAFIKSLQKPNGKN
jgi:hypothetical protein